MAERVAEEVSDYKDEQEEIRETYWEQTGEAFADLWNARNDNATAEFEADVEEAEQIWSEKQQQVRDNLEWFIGEVSETLDSLED